MATLRIPPTCLLLLLGCDPAASAPGTTDMASAWSGASDTSVAGTGGRDPAAASPTAPAGAGGASGSHGSASGGSGGADAAGGTAGTPSVPEVPAVAPPTATVDPSAELYDPQHVVRFDLELDAAARSALSAVTSADDPAQDQYVPATLRYGDETLQVGVRLKGEGSFRRLDRKAAFKIKVDEVVADQRLRGVRRLTLNNMVEDPSFLAERLAYELFREAGLPAPRCNSALVYVDGELFGLYANVEAEDKTFLARWFTSNDGNLYEEGQVDFVPGAETTFELETNETANDRSDLIALIAAIDGASDTTFLTDLGAELDTAQFLRFTAAEAAVNQWDMYGYTVFYPNNFRIYRDPASARFVFLPWGMDMSMKPYRDSGRPHIALFELARQYDRPNGPISAGLLLRRCLESAACVTAYRAAVLEIIDVYERADLAPRAERYYQQIREHAASDPRSEYGEDEFERGIEALLSTIRERPAALRADLAQ